MFSNLAQLTGSHQRSPLGIGQHILATVNAILLGVPAAVAHKDYEDRRRRQAKRTAEAEAVGVYKGRHEKAARNEGIATMLRIGTSWEQIESVSGCSKGTIAKVRKRLNVAKANVLFAEVSPMS